MRPIERAISIEESESSEPSRDTLEEILRPEAKVIELSDHGLAIPIDGQMVLAYRETTNKFGDLVGDIVVAKKKKKYVLYDGTLVYDPPAIPDGEDFASYFVTLKSGRDHFYIGEQYQVEIGPMFRRTGAQGIYLMLRSTHAIEDGAPIPGYADFSEYLRSGKLVPMKPIGLRHLAEDLDRYAGIKLIV